MLFFKNITWSNKRIVPEWELQSVDFKKRKKKKKAPNIPAYLTILLLLFQSYLFIKYINPSFLPPHDGTSVDPGALCSLSALVPSSWPFLRLEFMPQREAVCRVLRRGPRLELEPADFLSHWPVPGGPEIFSSGFWLPQGLDSISFAYFILIKLIYFYQWIRKYLQHPKRSKKSYNKHPHSHHPS